MSDLGKTPRGWLCFWDKAFAIVLGDLQSLANVYVDAMGVSTPWGILRTRGELADVPWI